MNYITSRDFWHWTPNGKMQCDLCPRACQLNEGQRGLCFVRAREKDEMVLTTYGLSSGLCVDPIEKKPLNHFYPGHPVLSFGTAGCNLSCRFCQNWDMSKSKEMETLSRSAEPEEIVQLAKENKCRSIAYTYNDPVIFMEFARDVATIAKENQIYSVAVTAGYITEKARPSFFQFIDAANVDLKSFNPQFYKKICGGHLENVLETLIYLKRETQIWFELTTLIIPDENDSEKEIRDMSEWIVEKLGRDVPIHFSAFHPDYKMQNKPRTSPESLSQIRRWALDEGIQFVYTGNVRDQEGDTTFCPQCSKPLIERDWYEIKSFEIKNESCPYCKSSIPGRFNNQEEKWGRRRKSL